MKTLLRTGRIPLGVRLLRFLLYSAAAVLIATPARAGGIDDTARLASAGAIDLALTLIDRAQPPRERLPGRWAEWEALRLRLLADKGDWRRLLDRTAGLPEDLPAGFLRQALDLRARALLREGRPRKARAVWRRLIWQDAEGAGDDALRSWRFGVLRALMAEGDHAIALAAWRRFQADYPELGPEERRARVRFALRVGAPDEALEWLAEREDALLLPLKHLARLRAGVVPPATVLAEAVKDAAGLEDEAVRGRLWLVAAEAARLAGKGRERVHALEQALRLLPVADDPLLPVRADPLWDAWLDYAEWLGNRERLLVGDDEAWLARAGKERDPHKRRALYALVAIEGAVEAGRRRGHAGLLASLPEDAGHLLENLYLHSAHFPAESYIPDVVRLRLAEQALTRGRHALASRLMQAIDRPPEGVDPFDWELRLARIHILGGDEDRGIDRLYLAVGSRPRFTREEADRFLQVVFDLQTLRRDREALRLMGALMPRLQDRRQMRELLYWMADSHRARGDHERAAAYYLRSALFEDGVGLDPWGRTARFQAAEALADAGLVDDARRLYEGLLRIATDRKRRIVLRQRLQQLHLR